MKVRHFSHSARHRPPTFFAAVLSGNLPVRSGASYFPFTETVRLKVDVQWRGRWLEVMGCGQWSIQPAPKDGLDAGNAGAGFSRRPCVRALCMVPPRIDDIRRLYMQADLRFPRAVLRPLHGRPIELDTSPRLAIGALRSD